LLEIQLKFEIAFFAWVLLLVAFGIAMLPNDPDGDGATPAAASLEATVNDDAPGTTTLNPKREESSSGATTESADEEEATAPSTPPVKCAHNKRRVESAFSSDASEQQNNTSQDERHTIAVGTGHSRDEGAHDDDDTSATIKRNKRTASLLLGTGASFAHPRIGDEYQTALPEFIGKKPPPVLAAPVVCDVAPTNECASGEQDCHDERLVGE
jgi:hypothetical protein